MTAGSRPTDETRHLRRALAVVVAVGVALATVFLATMREEPQAGGPTVGEKVEALRTERASLQGRADSEARIGLLPAFRIASLLFDALAVRSETEGDRAFDELPAFRRQIFGELDELNGALRDALDRPGDGSRLAANKTASQAASQLDRLAGDDAPLILSYTPRFVPPRSATGELTLAPGAPGVAPQGALQVDKPGGRTAGPATQVVPRYAPDFAATGDQEPPLQIEIVGLHLAPASAAPVLSVGGWRGQATVAPGRLRFSVPRAAFATDARRTSFHAATLLVRRGSRTASFQLLFTVLPDRPGSFAFDQRMRTTSQESNTLVSPEILSRAPAGETRTVRRCFDPPDGWRFDKERQRVVIVERLGWQEDVSDPTLNSGSVDLVPADEPGQVCIAVVARPVVRAEPAVRAPATARPVAREARAPNLLQHITGAFA